SAGPRAARRHMTSSGTPTTPGRRPGTTYFSPAVRIARLDKLSVGREQGALLPDDVLYDVTHVAVSRVNSGPSQYTITLNNMYLSTATDRAGAERRDTGTQPRESAATRELLVKGRPAWPRFKYNDFHHLAFGQRLRIDMRYWPEQSSDPEQPGP